MKHLNIEENDNAFKLFMKCIKGFFTILWIAINFLFQPILFIFWIVILIPVKILLFIGMNLPGNKYNLTFSYQGKKQYSSNLCALTSVFIVAFLFYYFFLSFVKVGTNLNVSQ